MAEVHSGYGQIASQFLHDRIEIGRAFRALRDHCMPVKIQFASADETFVARLIDVTDTHIVLEDIRPRAGMALLRGGEPFSLAARADGIYARADALAIAETAADRGVPYFIVPLPGELLYQQRRRSTRFRLPLSATADDACITLTRAERPLSGYLADISTGGCRGIFDAVSDPEIRENELVTRCDIEIPQVLTLSTTAVIRHHSLNKQTGQLACGIEFEKMPMPERRRLERFIAQLARISDPG